MLDEPHWAETYLGTTADGVVLYHRTKAAAASSILTEGFVDQTGSYMMVGIEVTGVWLSNVPLDAGEGAHGDVVLRVLISASEGELSEFELVEDGKPFREWCVPSRLIASRGVVQIVGDGEDVPDRFGPEPRSKS